MLTLTGSYSLESTGFSLDLISASTTSRAGNPCCQACQVHHAVVCKPMPRLAQPYPSQIQPALKPWRLYASAVVFRCLSTFLFQFFHLLNISLFTQHSCVFTPPSHNHSGLILRRGSFKAHEPVANTTIGCRWVDTKGVGAEDQVRNFSYLSTVRLSLSLPPWSPRRALHAQAWLCTNLLSRDVALDRN